jgi:hypothetical protein
LASIHTSCTTRFSSHKIPPEGIHAARVIATTSSKALASTRALSSTASLPLVASRRKSTTPGAAITTALLKSAAHMIKAAATRIEILPFIAVHRGTNQPVLCRRPSLKTIPREP